MPLNFSTEILHSHTLNPAQGPYKVVSFNSDSTTKKTRFIEKEKISVPTKIPAGATRRWLKLTTTADLQDFVAKHFQKTLSSSWVTHFIQRNDLITICANNKVLAA
jgi:hypothetical protein